VIGTLAATMACLRETMRGRAMRASTSRSFCITSRGWSPYTRRTRELLDQRCRWRACWDGSTLQLRLRLDRHTHLTPLEVIGPETQQSLHAPLILFTAGLDPDRCLRRHACAAVPGRSLRWLHGHPCYIERSERLPTQLQMRYHAGLETL